MNADLFNDNLPYDFRLTHASNEYITLIAICPIVCPSNTRSYYLCIRYALPHTLHINKVNDRISILDIRTRDTKVILG